jgi:hypothetical protein
MMYQLCSRHAGRVGDIFGRNAPSTRPIFEKRVRVRHLRWFDDRRFLLRSWLPARGRTQQMCVFPATIRCQEYGHLANFRGMHTDVVRPPQ